MALKEWMNAAGRLTDAVVYAFDPKRGAARMAVRKSWDRFSAVYHDGASQDRLHAGKWLGSKISPDSALELDLETLRERSHELYRSDSLGGMVDMMVDHTVGQGFTYNSKIKAVPGLSGSAADGMNAEIEAMLEQWATGVDISRLESLWEHARLVARHLFIDGEAFVVFWNSRDAGFPIPLVLEVIDPERVETPPEKASDANCRMGIQYDGAGRIIGYWVRTTHPHDLVENETKYNLIPKSRCLHLIEKWFAKQSRGYPWMTRVINDARDGKDIREAGLVTAQTQACLSVWIKGGTSPRLSAESRSTGVDSAGRRLQSVQPGSVNYTGTDEEPLFMVPSGTSPLADLLTLNDRRIAAGMNVPYEFIARNWSGVSFAGGRLVLNQAKISVGVKQKLIVNRILAPVYREAVKQAVIVGAVEINASAFNNRPWVYTRHTWTPPLWSYAITPGEEVNALLDAVEGNLISQEAATSQYSGEDLDELIPQRGKEMDAQRKANCLPPDRVKAEAAATSAEKTPQGKEAASV